MTRSKSKSENVTDALTTTRRRTRSQAIRAKCLDCCCDIRKEVEQCTIKNCPLWRYRMGYEMDLKGNRVKKGKKEDSE